MIPGYDFYAEEEDPSPYRWVILRADGTTFFDATAFFDGYTDAHITAEISRRRKMFPGYTVKLLKDGQVWEPTA